jgi:Holliday junction resolvasome RuvABC ATP-dependent DNA helicase subunit
MRRPKDFHGFIGQRRAVRFLQRQLRGAQALGQPCPHLLFVGESGMGKTRLARALAKEYGTELHVLLGKANPAQLCERLVRVRRGDFLFLDEAHNLPRDTQESLYEVIDDWRVKDRVGDKAEVARDADGRLIIQPHSLILATDQPGELLNALQKRMGYTVTLTKYSMDELIEITYAAASQLDLLLSPQGMRAVAGASQGQPRRAKQHLEGLRRAFHSSTGQLSVENVRHYLKSAGVDAAGLDRLQREYLRKLRRLGTASLDTLANLVGVDAAYARGQVEPGLVALGFLRISQSGRRLTPAGREWARRGKTSRKEGEGAS